ncbi:MAG: sulfatase-like hydrolase/transferase [Desulfobacterales bacterium]
MIRKTLELFAAWSFLNVLMNGGLFVWHPFLAALLIPSGEIILLLAVMAAAARWDLPFHPLWHLPAIAFLLLIRLFTLADLLAPHFLNRPFNLALDAVFLPDLVHLLYKSVSPVIFSAGFFLLIVFVFLLCISIHRSLAVAHGFLRIPRQRRLFWGFAALALLVMAGMHHVAGAATPAGRAFGSLQRLAEDIRFILTIDDYRRDFLLEQQQTGQTSGDPVGAISKLNNNDVYLFLIESYGGTAYAKPEHYDLFRPVLQRLQRDLSAAGFAIASNFVTSPTFGGMSWLAHASAVSGLRIDSPLAYRVLLTSTVGTIVHRFNAAGYRTVCVMPGTVRPWPEGSFFGYQRIYTQPVFGYRGPAFDWSPMPDQFAMDVVRRREMTNRRPPLFISFVLGSSHAPFRRLPPYLSDWSRLGDGSVFDALEPITFPLTWSDMSGVPAAYIAALTYSLEVIHGFLENFVHDDALIIIMGDHQPNAQVTGPQASWSVPVHVLSRNPELLEPYSRRRYTPGLIPSQPPPHEGMEHVLTDLFVRVNQAGRLD